MSTSEGRQHRVDISPILYIALDTTGVGQDIHLLPSRSSSACLSIIASRLLGGSLDNANSSDRHSLLIHRFVPCFSGP